MHLLRDKPAGRFSPARLFRPDSLVVIGAATVGAQVMANILAAGFKGAMVAADTPSEIAALPAAADLAVIAAPAVAGSAAGAGRQGHLRRRRRVGAADGLADPAAPRPACACSGPRSFGIAVPGIGLNASRAHLPPPAGRLGLVSQSASLCRAVLDWAQPNGVGFSHIVGIGGNADIGFGLVLDWLSRDPGTGAILLDIRHLQGPPRLPLRRPRRVAAAAGGGDPSRRPAGRPERRRPNAPSRRRCAAPACCASPASRTCWPRPRPSPAPARCAARR